MDEPRKRRAEEVRHHHEEDVGPEARRAPDERHEDHLLRLVMEEEGPRQDSPDPTQEGQLQQELLREAPLAPLGPVLVEPHPDH